MSSVLSEALHLLADRVSHLAERQITDSGHPEAGGIVSFDKETLPQHIPFVGVGSGLPEVVATFEFVAAYGYLYIAGRRGITDANPRAAEFVTRATAGMDFLIHSQRPSGLIDLINCNFDSSPDTGFCVQMLAPLLQTGGEWRGNDPAWNGLCDRIETFVRRAVPGLITGGFHTPNHRWIMSSALALAARFVPGVESAADRGGVAAAIDPMLAEGIDIDAEGAFIERSVVVYDAVCDRSLLFLEEFWPAAHAAGAARAAIANLEFDLYLLNHDGAAETGLSRRQDYGTKAVPVSLAACYLLAGHTPAGATKKTAFNAAANFLWQKACQNGDPLIVPNLNWLVYALLVTNADATLGGVSKAPPDFARHFPANGFWRARRGALAATAFTNTTRLLHLNFGLAELAGLKISQSYFGAGLFVADTLQGDDSSTVLRSGGCRVPRRPGYELPLGSPVPPADWEKLRHTRPLRAIPPAVSELAITLLPGNSADGAGLELHYRTTDGVDKVATQIALDFVPGGIWESGDLITKPVAGQVLFLKHGSGRMRYGLDVIEIEGGAHAHTMWAMRDSETAPAHVRVLLTFLTPVDHRFVIKTWRGL
jgi:hypothetical protein